MNTRQLIVFPVLIYTALHILLFFQQTIDYIYLPFWGRLLAKNSATIFAWLAAMAICFICFFKLRGARKYSGVILCLASIGLFTFLQLLWVKDYQTYHLSENITLQSYSEFSSNSSVYKFIREDANKEFSELKELFLVDNCKKLHIALFSSTEQMQELTGRYDARAFFNPIKSTIYISLSEWNESYRHELVHYFQEQRQHTSYFQLLTNIDNTNQLKVESLAFYLAPHTNIHCRSIDLIRAVSLTSPIVHPIITFESFGGVPSKYLQEQYVRYANFMLATLRWHLCANDKLVVESYFTNSSSTNLNRSIESKKDIQSERYCQYYYGENLPMLGKADSNFRSLHEYYAVFDSLSDSAQISIAKFNLEQRTILPHKIDWEIVLDTLHKNQRFSAASKLRNNFYQSMNMRISNEKQINNLSDSLHSYLSQAIVYNYKALAAYVYVHLLNIECVMGLSHHTTIPQVIESMYSLSYQEYIQYLKNKISGKQVGERNPNLKKGMRDVS